MRTSTSAFLPYLRPIFHLLSALLVLGATASCSSSKSAFQFRPAPAGQVQQVAAAPFGAEAAVQPEATRTVTQPSNPHKHSPAKPKPRLRQLARPVAAVVQGSAVSAAQEAPKSRATVAPAKVRRVFSPQRPAEVGLGTTVLGVLGLIVLPISLLGLLIWGGPVWLVLAGLSALAVLIAYLDPFG